MKYVRGLYISLVLMMAVILINTSLLNDEYSGIAMFVALVIFIIGTAFFMQVRIMQHKD